MRASVRGGARVPIRSLRLLEDVLRWGSSSLFSPEKLAEAAAADAGMRPGTFTQDNFDFCTPFKSHLASVFTKQFIYSLRTYFPGPCAVVLSLLTKVHMHLPQN